MLSKVGKLKLKIRWILCCGREIARLLATWGIIWVAMVNWDTFWTYVSEVVPSTPGSSVSISIVQIMITIGLGYIVYNCLWIWIKAFSSMVIGGSRETGKPLGRQGRFIVWLVRNVQRLDIKEV